MFYLVNPVNAPLGGGGGGTVSALCWREACENVDKDEIWKNCEVLNPSRVTPVLQDRRYHLFPHPSIRRTPSPRTLTQRCCIIDSCIIQGFSTLDPLPSHRDVCTDWLNVVLVKGLIHNSVCAWEQASLGKFIVSGNSVRLQKVRKNSCGWYESRILISPSL